MYSSLPTVHVHLFFFFFFLSCLNNLGKFSRFQSDKIHYGRRYRMVQGGCQTVRETGRLSGERSFLVFACEPMKSMCIYPFWLLPKWSPFFSFSFSFFHSSSGAFPDAAYKCIPRFWPRELSMVDYGLVPRFNVPRFQGWKLLQRSQSILGVWAWDPEKLHTCRMSMRGPCTTYILRNISVTFLES